MLTFDDGPDPVNTPILLDILKKRDIKATFFVLGQMAIDQPDILYRMAQEGINQSIIIYLLHYYNY
jgi:peptidoglycan/xylan/chitin deacetylase (PgdA/CDA1 family)